MNPRPERAQQAFWSILSCQNHSSIPPEVFSYEFKTMTTNDAPQGELVLRTLAMPADTNANGDIFGGWLMSQMDMGGAILAKRSRMVAL